MHKCKCSISQYNQHEHFVSIIKQFTCNELHIVKSHRKTVVLALTANIPIIHVTPSKGNSIIAPSIDDLIIHT